MFSQIEKIFVRINNRCIIDAFVVFLNLALIIVHQVNWIMVGHGILYCWWMMTHHEENWVAQNISLNVNK